MKQRSWTVFPSLRGVLIGVQVVLIVMMLAGAVCLVAGAKTLMDSRRFMATATAADAVVADVAGVVEQVRRGSGDNWYYEDTTVLLFVIGPRSRAARRAAPQDPESSES